MRKKWEGNKNKMWDMGQVGCDIWEKWVGGRKTKYLKNKNKRWDMGRVGGDVWEKWAGGWRNQIPECDALHLAAVSAQIAQVLARVRGVHLDRVPVDRREALAAVGEAALGRALDGELSKTQKLKDEIWEEWALTCGRNGVE